MAVAVRSEEDLILSRADAEAILRSHERTVLRIVRCCDDGAVLYLAASHRPMTAWMHRQPDGGLDVSYEPGWPVVPGFSRFRPPQSTIPSEPEGDAS